MRQKHHQQPYDIWEKRRISPSEGRVRYAQPIHIEDLDLYNKDFTETLEQKSYRLFLTLGLVGLITALVLSVFVANVLHKPTSNIRERINTLNVKPEQSTEKIRYSDRSVVFKEQLPNHLGRKKISEIVVPRRRLDGHISEAYPSISSDSLPYGSDSSSIQQEARLSYTPSANITTITKSLPEPLDEVIVFSKSTPLTQSIEALGIDHEQSLAMVRALETVFPTSSLKVGQKITVTLERQLDFYGQDAITPVSLSFSPEAREEIIVEADEDGQFSATLEGGGSRSKYVDIPYVKATSKVGASLYATAKDYGVPDYVITQMMQVYAYDVDFQRQVKANDTFHVFYGTPLTGTSKKRKVLLFSSLTVDGETKKYYRYTNMDGETGYYDEKGLSARRSLMRTPVPGSRISSGFGMRRHPILGYNKMHMGVDFSAPYGTPIRAAGDGVVVFSGWQGAYGKIIKIKHANGYETLYGHMSKIVASLEPGERVRQGQVIGFVGSTGMTTGPHAHFEVRIAGRPVNPLLVKGFGGEQLAGRDLELFRTQKNKIGRMMRTAPAANKLAGLSGPKMASN